MKRWIVLLAAVLIAAAVGGMPFAAVDVAKLQPVEAVYVEWTGGQVRVCADTGDTGTGVDAAQAFADLQRSSASELFLDTAEYLFLGPGGERVLPQLYDLLRPACEVCFSGSGMELADAAAYLDTHAGPPKLRELQAGEGVIPTLTMEGGRMRLE